MREEISKRGDKIDQIVSDGEKILNMALEHTGVAFESEMTGLLCDELGKDAQSLSLRECHVLKAISENKEYKASEISTQLNLTRGGISKILARLEKKGYVKTSPKKGNKRERALSLTSRGIAAVRIHEELHEKSLNKWKSLLDTYDNDELSSLEELFQRVLELGKTDLS